jgi:hypothetical protein
LAMIPDFRWAFKSPNAVLPTDLPPSEGGF